MSIFVSIPAFRDVEAQHTIACLFDNAAHPDRVFVGVFHQIKPGDQVDRIPYPRPQQVREKRIDADEATGPCFARHIVQSLYHGEEYFLSLDSHMRLLPAWDVLLIEELALCNVRKLFFSFFFFETHFCLHKTTPTLIPALAFSDFFVSSNSDHLVAES